MVSHGSVVKKVRERKEKHPEQYCAVKECLWRIKGGTMCPKHTRMLLNHLQEATNA